MKLLTNEIRHLGSNPYVLRTLFFQQPWPCTGSELILDIGSQDELGETANRVYTAEVYTRGIYTEVYTRASFEGAGGPLK